MVILAKAGCHPWPSPTYTYDEHRSASAAVTPYPECPVFNSWVQSQLLDLKPMLTIVSGGIGTLSSLASEPAIGVKRGVATLAASIAKSGSKVIMLGNTPWFIQDQPSPLCLSLHRTSVARCSIATSLLKSPSRPLMSEMSKAIDLIVKDNVVPLVRVLPLLCTKVRCPTISASTVMYFDGTHISRQWAVHVVPALTELLRPFIPKP
ncbi:MAG: SGNH hydrolase domain-containing protein [Actinomycetota bacterium]